MTEREYTGTRTGGPNRVYKMCMTQPPPEMVTGSADGTKMVVWLPCDLPEGHGGPHSVDRLEFPEDP